MITVTLDDSSGQPLYEQLYRHIRQGIEAGTFRAGDRLPSKRKIAEHLRVSLRTVENAYAQLAVEGYVEAIEKKAYYVRQVDWIAEETAQQSTGDIRSKNPEKPRYRFDLKTNRIHAEDFPFSIWTRLMRENLRNEISTLLEPTHPQGDWPLRQEIARYLQQFRGMSVDAEQIVLGAGTEYLLGLVAELLPGSVFALENPNYSKPAKVLRSRGIPFVSIAMNEEGLSMNGLAGSPASVVLCAPSHHFPLGTVMTISRRMQLLHWASERQGRYLIEDDYDSEFRFSLKPVPALQGLDRSDKVIYLNTFTRTLAPSLRIAYLVLPRPLLEEYRSRLAFYASTVSQFEQGTLQKFIQGGFYERHLNRIRNIYRSRRDILLGELSALSDSISIAGQDAGLHLLVTADNGLTDSDLVARAAEKGVRVYALSGYYIEAPPATSTVVIGYAGFDEEALRHAARLLVEAWQD
jgi:Transcriptional regulators containing a DNA-binding HTH domain and an aminotransferase domain (MocR family) and their eukaryotic orthologs